MLCLFVFTNVVCSVFVSVLCCVLFVLCLPMLCVVLYIVQCCVWLLFCFLFIIDIVFGVVFNIMQLVLCWMLL